MSSSCGATKFHISMKHYWTGGNNKGRRTSPTSIYLEPPACWAVFSLCASFTVLSVGCSHDLLFLADFAAHSRGVVFPIAAKQTKLCKECICYRCRREPVRLMHRPQTLPTSERSHYGDVATMSVKELLSAVACAQKDSKWYIKSNENSKRQRYHHPRPPGADLRADIYIRAP